jgi:hypothetical protein
MDFSSALRSRSSACALAGLSHSAESPACAFSSERRLTAASQSKMPPQQSQGLLDFGNQVLRLRAHVEFRVVMETSERA